jgi:galactose-1-phosphate uridylyltransferase
MVRDNLAAACEYIAFVRRRDSEARYPLYIWNHLMPSAASIVHPHTHILVERRATPYQERLLTSSRRYFRNSGGSFWKEIVAEERKRGERYIGGCGSVSVIASFAPQGNREVQLIISGASSLAQLREEQIGDFAHAVVKILLCYHQMGVNSFNLSTFSAPEGEGLDYYSLNAKVISRPIMQPFYRNDTGIMERLHYETADIEIEPEEVARAMRGFF